MRYVMPPLPTIMDVLFSHCGSSQIMDRLHGLFPPPSRPSSHDSVLVSRARQPALSCSQPHPHKINLELERLRQWGNSLVKAASDRDLRLPECRTRRRPWRRN